jgi:hypothetical protein
MGEEADLAQSPAASPAKVPRTRTSRSREPDPTAGARHTVAPTSAKPSRTSTTKPTSKPSASKESTPPPRLPPSTGTVSWTDANEYCKAQGYSSYSFVFTAGWSDLRCSGSDTKISATTLCQWKYPGYARAEGVPPDNVFTPTATCHLS